MSFLSLLNIKNNLIHLHLLVWFSRLSVILWLVSCLRRFRKQGLNVVFLSQSFSLCQGITIYTIKCIKHVRGLSLFHYRISTKHCLHKRSLAKVKNWPEGFVITFSRSIYSEGLSRVVHVEITLKMGSLNHYF